MSDNIPSWVSVVERLVMLRAEHAPDDEPDYDHLVGEDLTITEVAELLIILGEINTAAWAAKKMVAAKLEAMFKETGKTYLEAAGYAIIFKPKRTTRVVDADGFWEFMRANPEYLEPAFNPNSARKTGVPEAVFDTFFKTEEVGDPVITEVPMWVIEDNRNKRKAKEEEDGQAS